MTTRLLEVSGYMPPTPVSIETIGDAMGLSPIETRLYRKFYGLRQVLVDPDAQLADLLVSAAKGLGSLAGVAGQIRYVIHARTIHEVAPYSVNPLTDACRRLGLEHAVSFAVTEHACASGLLAVEVAGRLLAGTAPGTLALVLTGEKAYPHVAATMPVPTVMGESTAACLIGHDGAGDEMLSYATRTYGEFHSSNSMSRRTRAAFLRMYPQALLDVMTAAAEGAGRSLADIDLVLPHNVNRISWAGFGQFADFPIERIFLDNVPITGHSFCADPFVNYASAVDRDLLGAGDAYMMVSVGLGATFSAMVLRKDGGR